MLNNIKKPPFQFIVLLLWFITLVLLIYVSYKDLPKIYIDASSYGINKNEINHFIIFQSYMIVTIIVIYILLLPKLMEITINKKIGIDGLLTFNFKNAISLFCFILPSPLYMLVQIEFWMNYHPLLNTTFISLSIMAIISLIISLIKKHKNLKTN